MSPEHNSDLKIFSMRRYRNQNLRAVIETKLIIVKFLKFFLNVVEFAVYTLNERIDLRIPTQRNRVELV